jgi:hypothetical protein
MPTSASRCIRFSLLPILAVLAFAQTPGAPGKPAPSGASATGQGEFFIHAFHKDKLGGELDCTLCHVPVKEGSVVLKRPGHDQCMGCHDADFNQTIKQSVCAQCHSAFPGDAANLLPYPAYKSTRTILFSFSHASHVDPKARLDAKTGFRADCTTCHKFEASGAFGTFPGHQECAVCHSKPGFTPQLIASMPAAGCRNCHNAEEIENPGFTESRRLQAKEVASGKYENIVFSHAAHFKVRAQYNLNCTTCHYAIPNSKSLADLTLPKMLDCVQCHDSARTIPAAVRMTNCSTCHTNPVTLVGNIPKSHTLNVKPDFHTDAFRVHHEEQASAPDAKCFICHQNVTPSLAAKNQCDSCHQVMRPVNHTARFKDDIHGKIAALDRTTCATCHTADYCSSCHNELPRSHVPLPLYKGGGHAVSAMLDQRACMTCHTFQNTCAQCHTNKIGMNRPPNGTPQPAGSAGFESASFDWARLLQPRTPLFR